MANIKYFNEIENVEATQFASKPDVVSHSDKVLLWPDYLAFILLSSVNIYAIMHFFLYWFGRQGWHENPIIYALVTLAICIVILNNQGQWFLLFCMKKPRPMTVKPDWKVAVLTTFVPDAEPLEMLERTVQALIALDYPHDTWVLDEGDDEQVKVLCRNLGAHHFSRKHHISTQKSPLLHTQTGNETFKAASKHGNYNVWLYTIGFRRYEIITTFDPDHIPEPGFLSAVLGYFNDPRVAYVQTAPAYYNQQASFIARGAAEETYDYHSFVQMASHGMGYPILIGSHSTHRVAALQQVGGLAPHDADDILLTLFYRLQGWQGVYVPVILARGLTPVDWRGYLTQQRRWTRSVLDIKLRLYPKLSRHLTFTARIMSLLHGLNYLHRSLIIGAVYALLCYMLITGAASTLVSDLLRPPLALVGVALQLCVLYRQRFYLDWVHERGVHWRVALLHMGKWLYMLLAFIDFVLGKNTPYAITRKIQDKSRPPCQTVFFPHIVVVLCLGAAWSIGASLGHITQASLHITAGIALSSLLMVILAGCRRFPSPYETRRRDRHEP